MVALASESASAFLICLAKLHPAEFLEVQKGDHCGFPGIHYHTPTLADVEERLQILLEEYDDVDRRDDLIKCKTIYTKIIFLLALAE